MTPFVWYRALRPDDGELLDQIMEGMSPQSRYQRYHGPKPRLTSGDRRYLTCDATCEIWFERDGQVIGAGRATRVINRRLRRALAPCPALRRDIRRQGQSQRRRAFPATRPALC